jgi:hypothetical protein
VNLKRLDDVALFLLLWGEKSVLLNIKKEYHLASYQENQDTQCQENLFPFHLILEAVISVEMS